jgi:hypothetical protein
MRHRFGIAGGIALGLALVGASPAAAQEHPALELAAGWAIFVDDAFAFEPAIGAGIRVPITQRVSIGPEVFYIVGPGSSRSLMITGNVVYDFVTDGRVEPYVIGGLGLFLHSEQFADETFRSTEGAFTAGGGARIWLNPSIYVAPELRVGWESHMRATVTVGIRF